MKSITPKDTRYLPFVQQRWCCASACISMVMYKHKLPLMPQEELGYQFGLIVPVEHRHLFWAPRKGKKPKSGFGTQIGIGKKEFDINAVFKKLKIPLRMNYRCSKDFSEDELLNVLTKAEKQNKDILFCFDAGVLDGTRYRGGHVCVFDRINVKTKTIRMIDPSQNQPKWRQVPLKQLYKAMEYHWDKAGGFWEFEK